MPRCPLGLSEAEKKKKCNKRLPWSAGKTGPWHVSLSQGSGQLVHLGVDCLLEGRALSWENVTCSSDIFEKIIEKSRRLVSDGIGKEYLIQYGSHGRAFLIGIVRLQLLFPIKLVMHNNFFLNLHYLCKTWTGLSFISCNFVHNQVKFYVHFYHTEEDFHMTFNLTYAK